MRDIPENTGLLGEKDLKRYQGILAAILERRQMLSPVDPNMGSVFFQNKIGVITFKDGAFEMNVDGHGTATIFPDGNVKGNFESLAQWFVSADEACNKLQKLSDEEIGRYSRVLSGVQSKFAKNGLDTVSLYLDGKSGTLKFVDDKIIMRVEGLGTCTIFIDGNVEGDADTFVQWFLRADEDARTSGAVFAAIRSTSMAAQDTLKDK